LLFNDRLMRNLKEAVKFYLKYCEQNRNMSPLTLKAYSIDLEQFVLMHGDIKLELISKAEIESYHFKLKDAERTPRTIKRKLASLKAMFKWLEIEEYLSENPFNKYQLKIKVPKLLPKTIPKPDMKKMFDVSMSELGLNHFNFELRRSQYQINSKKDLNKFTTVLTVELLLSTGLRISELANIKNEDIFIQERKIKIFGKGSRERFVFLTNIEHVWLIEAYQSAKTIVLPNSNHLLVNSRGGAASTQFLRKLIRVLAKTANVPNKVTPHMFRHSAASELLESGVDIRFVQKLLGHSSISTTEIYTHVNDRALKERLVLADIRSQILQRCD